ncbi:tetraacyldisaccharide 4'-kinase [Acinetobacter sp. c3-l95]|uniref:tetraacyldisaccharide 4'-kinase n=1 Tax=Acinetobacter sp. c3-l95 TaxID=3342804 RepID=UPI0035B73C81
MSLGHFIQSAWQKQSSWLIVLRPLSWLYQAVFNSQKNKQLKNAYRAKVPVMIIGNITVGGSGKTPLIIALVKFLQAQGIKVGVISRGYGGKGNDGKGSGFPLLVTPQSLPSQVGDEPVLIAQSVNVPMAVAPQRKEAIELLLKNHDIELILSDDGLQHYALARDIEWVVLDIQRGLGNQKLLPEGFLREPVQRLNDVTVIEHGTQSKTTYHMHLQVGQVQNLADKNLSFDATQHYQAVVGIGYPQRFFNTLNQLNLNYAEHIFADHHAYQAHDLKDIFAKGDVITTSKDAVKLLELYAGQTEILTKIWIVTVDAILSDDCYQLLSKQLSDLAINSTASNAD